MFFFSLKFVYKICQSPQERTTDEKAIICFLVQLQFPSFARINVHRVNFSFLDLNYRWYGNFYTLSKLNFRFLRFPGKTAYIQCVCPILQDGRFYREKVCCKKSTIYWAWYSPVNLSGVWGDLGPIKSRLWRWASARFIRVITPLIRVAPLKLVPRNSKAAYDGITWLSSVEFTKSRFWKWDSVVLEVLEITLVALLVTWLRTPGQEWWLLSMLVTSDSKQTQRPIFSTLADQLGEQWIL